MGRAQSRSTLSQSIAEILGTAEPIGNAAIRPGPFRKSLIYSSMALLAINPVAVNAVGLGEISVNSQLGQPLDATVPVTLAPGESMPKDCVAPARGSSGIGTPSTLRVSSPAAARPGTYNLRVTTTNALHEPMYEISLLIDCPGTPLLLRQYVLMLDLPGMNVSPPATGHTNTLGDNLGDTLTVPAGVAQAASTQAFNRATIPATNQRAARSLQRSGAMIPAGQSYRVRNGDTLSTIAARITGRSPDTTWSVANLIFSSNPHAFIRDNPDLIKLGSLIDIPDVAELTGLEKGRSTIISSRTSVAAAKQTITQPESFSEPRPAPVPAPIAAPLAKNRPEVFVTEPKPKQPDSTALYSAQDTGVDRTEGAYQPFAAQPTTTSAAQSGDAAVITPFLDEQPVPPGAGDAPESAADSVVQPIPVVTTTARSEPAESINPLLAILVGMLLGVFVSLLTLRRQLIDTLVKLVRRRTPAVADHARVDTSPSTNDDEDVVADTDIFETSVADSAFEARQEESGPLPITNPAESTYIVEASEAEATAQVEALATQDFDPNTLGNIDESHTNPDDEMLAQLFDEDDSTLGEPDAEMFDPTGGLDAAATGTFSGPTVQTPVRADEQVFDPTAELPSELDDEMFDPTAEMPSGQPDLLLDETAQTSVDPDDAPDPSLMNALDSTLEQIDADVMFATASDLVDDFLDGSPTSEIPSEPTLGGELDALPSDGEDGLSETLKEALSLLEHEYEDEFTASQILERSEISRGLDEARVKDTENTDPPKRKVSG